jgi:predicted ATPase
MIRELQIQGFKLFVDQTFALRPLTVLAGMNGAGKTSVIHALLLAREASRRDDRIVELNGPFGLELGGFEDVLNQETAKSFSIKLLYDDFRVYEWTFSEGTTDLYANVTALTNEVSPAFVEVVRAFQYLSAERLGPRITLGSAALPPDLLEVGYRGEHCAQVLDTLGKLVIEDMRHCPNAGEDNLPLLKAQTEHWLSCITRPLQIDTESFAGTPVTALKFRTAEDWVKPTNMGFGVTYALPVVLAGLTAGVGGLLLIENPEAHLHPAGQSQIGLFLAAVAAAGVQVVAETHSDHVLNGIRRAIGERRILSSEQALVHYFDIDGAKPQPLAFTENGGISSWPKGFFDQYQIDISALTRIRRPR